MEDYSFEFRHICFCPGTVAVRVEVKAGEISYPEDAPTLAGQAKIMLELGVRIVGGCCGTTDGHIKALRGLIEN